MRPGPVRFTFAACLTLLSAALAHASDKPMPTVAVQGAYTDAIDHAFYATDPRFLLIADTTNKTTELWHLETATPIRTFPVGATAIAQSTISSKLALAADGTISIWDVAGGEKLLDIPGAEHHAESLSFSPDGRYLYGGGDWGVRKWDAVTGEWTGDRKDQYGVPYDVIDNRLRVSQFAFTSDGRRVVAANEFGGMVYIDARSGEQLFSGTTKYISLPGTSICADGRLVAFADFNAGHIEIWDLKKKAVVKKITSTDYRLSNVDFSPDCKLVAGGGRSVTRLWEVSSGELRHEFPTRADSVEFSTDGRRLLLVNSYDGEAIEFDIERGAELHRIGGTKSVAIPNPFGGRVAISADGDLLALSIGERTEAWNLETGRPAPDLTQTDALVASIAYSPDSSLVAIGDWKGRVTISNARSGEKLGVFGGQHTDPVNNIVFSADGVYALSSDYEGVVLYWDVALRKVLHRFVLPKALDSYPASLALSADGTRAAAVTLENGRGTLFIWDLATGDELGWLPTASYLRQVFFEGGSAESLLVLGYDAESATVIYRWIPDRNKLTTMHEGAGWGGLEDAVATRQADVIYYNTHGALRAVDTETGEQMYEVKAHEGDVNGLSLTADGRRLASFSKEDGTIAIWDAPSGLPLARLFVFPSADSSEIDWAMLTPEGFFDGTPGAIGKLAVVDGMNIYAIDQAYDALYRPDLVQAKLFGDPEGAVERAARELDLRTVLDSGLAPEIAIKELSSTRTDRDRVTLEAMVRDQGGGVGKIVWTVNGVTVGTDTRSGAKKAKDIQVRKSIRLSPGENRIEVLAYNADNLLASRPQSVVLMSTAKPGSSKTRLFILSVGIDDYRDGRLRLAYAVADARAISSSYAEAGRGAFDEVHVKTVTNSEATIAKLDATFASLAEEIDPDDAFIFFIAGHGVTTGGRYHFLPHDFRFSGEDAFAEGAVDQQKWQDWFSQIAARRSLLLFDTCESGSLTGSAGGLRSAQSIVAIEKMTRATGRTILAASTDSAPALEGVAGHGVFSYVLIRALGAADVNGDANVQVTELAGYVDRYVPEVSYTAFGVRQVPQMNLAGSDFAVGKSIAALPVTAAEETMSVAKQGTAMVAISRSPVRIKPSSDATQVGEVVVGVQLTAIRQEEDWLLVRRGEKVLGYIEQKNLVPLQ